MSPVNDAYHKKGLAPAQQRVDMCKLAAQTSNIVMVDSWEAEQPTYQRSLMVLQRVEDALNDQHSGDWRICLVRFSCTAHSVLARHIELTCWHRLAAHTGYSSTGSSKSRWAFMSAICSAGTQAASASSEPSEGDTRIRAMLLCGADMVASLAVPGVWKPEHVRVILGEHGLVCISRWVLTSQHCFLHSMPGGDICWAMSFLGNDGIGFTCKLLSHCRLISELLCREHSDIMRLLDDPSSPLHEFRHNIILVEDPIVNNISSTTVRQEFAQVGGHTFNASKALENCWPAHNHSQCSPCL
jgi:nicotinic acid mononucleotide adenylyltransferase